MKKNYVYLIALFLFFLFTAIFFVFFYVKEPVMAPTQNTIENRAVEREDDDAQKNMDIEPYAMSIEALRTNVYPGGQFEIEQQLANGLNYTQYIASYRSEGLKIYGLLTIPRTSVPENGFPAIVFVHGYIPPDQYSTTGDYPIYQATLAREGFVTFKPDLRGHGRSEGSPVSAHFSEKYVVDVLNAIAYIKDHPKANPEKIGYWGHSNGGQIGLRVAVIDPDVKAFALWAGVVGSYEDMFETYLKSIPFLNDRENPLILQHGPPSAKNDFWLAIEPFNYLSDITAPVHLHHGTNDQSVPLVLSESLDSALREENKQVELFRYSGDDHNISQNATRAWQRTIDFYQEVFEDGAEQKIDEDIS
jgi:uncharacterized protein